MGQIVLGCKPRPARLRAIKLVCPAEPVGIEGGWPARRCDVLISLNAPNCCMLNLSRSGKECSLGEALDVAWQDARAGLCADCGEEMSLGE